MSDAAEVLDALRAAGAEIGADGEHVKVLAVAGTVPPDLKARAASAREGILAILTGGRDASTRPEPSGLQASGGADVNTRVARVLALPKEERAAWRQEVIHAAVWAAAGKRDDPHLLDDLRVLRRVEAIGSCLRCGAACSADGRFWCEGCVNRYAKATEETR